METQAASTLWRVLIAGILIVHGLGHVGGPWFFTRSWLSPTLATGAAETEAAREMLTALTPRAG